MTRFGLIAIFVALANARAQDPLFQQAFGLYEAGRHAQAETLLLSASEKSALDLSLLGSIEFGNRHLEAAEKYLRQALQKQPELMGARRTLATVLEEEGKQGKALLASARLSNAQGRTEEALSFALKAKSLLPEDPAVLYAVGVLCLEMDLIKDATACLEHAAALQASPSILYALASARVAQRNLPSAIEIYGELIRNDPLNAQARYALGAAYFLEGQIDQAAASFEQSIAREPDQVESYFYLGEIADQDGNKQKSISLLKSVIARQPNHMRAHVALGMVYRSIGQLDEAKKELETAAQLDPKSQKAHYQLGLVLNSLGQAQQAKSQLDTASQLRASSDERISWQLASDHANKDH